MPCTAGKIIRIWSKNACFWNKINCFWGKKQWNWAYKNSSRSQSCKLFLKWIFVLCHQRIKQKCVKLPFWVAKLCRKNNVILVKKCPFLGQNEIAKWSKIVQIKKKLQKFIKILFKHEPLFWQKSKFCLVWDVQTKSS